MPSNSLHYETLVVLPDIKICHYAYDIHCLNPPAMRIVLIHPYYYRETPVCLSPFGICILLLFTYTPLILQLSIMYISLDPTSIILRKFPSGDSLEPLSPWQLLVITLGLATVFNYLGAITTDSWDFILP